MTCPFSKTTVLGSPLCAMASEPYHFDLVYRNTWASGLAPNKKGIGYTLNSHAAIALDCTSEHISASQVNTAALGSTAK